MIVQVRKLGEGFDHPYLSVAAVFSVFAKLSPFVQFVGRIMRVIVQDDPMNPKNQGTVVYHAGGNVGGRWADFQEYSGADQQYFGELLPVEELNFEERSELSIEPSMQGSEEGVVEVKGQSGVVCEEIPLLESDPELMRMLDVFRERGITPDVYKRAYEHQPLPTTRVKERQAARQSLDIRVKTFVGQLIGKHGLNSQGYDLDKMHFRKTNFVVLKSAIDRKISEKANRPSGTRHEYTREELDQIDNEFPSIMEEVEKEYFHA